MKRRTSRKPVRSKSRRSRELARLETRFPVGSRVRVIASDLDEYIGATGIVADYDLAGFPVDPSLVGVVFDTPIGCAGPRKRISTRDGFYDDELAVTTSRTVRRRRPRASLGRRILAVRRTSRR